MDEPFELIFSAIPLESTKSTFIFVLNFFSFFFFCSLQIIQTFKNTILCCYDYYYRNEKKMRLFVSLKCPNSDEYMVKSSFYWTVFLFWNFCQLYRIFWMLNAKYRFCGQINPHFMEIIYFLFSFWYSKLNK